MKKFLICLSLSIVILLLVLLLPMPNQSLASPVLGQSKLRFASNLWFPAQTIQDQSAPNITAQAALFVDTHSGQVLYTKNMHQRMHIASLTKIMTVITTLESKNFSDRIEISQRAADTEPDKMQLIGGEKLSIEELLDGVFLVSANDAAEALSEQVTGSRDEFIALMNEKAAQLGMKDSHFINPTGLEEDGVEQYSSAYDVALMAHYALVSWPHLVEISSQEHIYLPQSDTHQDYDLYSGINLLTTYPGVVGFKTGYTPEAGLTLVTLARQKGREVLGVILGATNRRDDARDLLDYSFKKLSINSSG